ncbi:MAG: LysR family transcriptional regulator [Gammaproteobacteria bacterium]|jgi:DNA-binding transcriptional LysR family regulator
MDIQLPRTFLELDRCRHFGKAVSVSARIRLLEETLGVDLFIRRGYEIQLTSAGERLKRHAETIVAAWQRALTDTALDEEHEMALSVCGNAQSMRLFSAELVAHSLQAASRDRAASGGA